MKSVHYVSVVHLTLRAILSDEALITDTHSVFTASLVVAVLWAGEYRAVWSGEALIAHAAAIYTVASV